MRSLPYTLIVTLAAAGVTQASLWRFDVAIDGNQETPPVSTPGTGTAIALLDDVTREMTIDGSFQDLIGTTTSAHLHGYAGAGTPGGVVFGLTLDVGVTAGNFSGAGLISASRIDDVLAGQTYINIHTTFKPGGEIRGQLVDPYVVPEPASGVLLGLLTFIPL